MAASRTWLLGSVAVFLALTIVPSGISQTLRVIPTRGSTTSPAEESCKVYSLSDLGDDPHLGKWIVDTIPQMIQPGSWNCAEGKSKLSYYAPGKVLVINQTAAVHVQVDEFLQNLQKTLAKTAAKHDAQVAPAQFTAPVARALAPPSPKHLFHFIIRNEGNGGIDPSFQDLGWFPMFINQYSSDPMVRMEQSLIDSENLRQMHDEWRRFWINDQPAHLTPYRIHGGVGPASSAIGDAPPTNAKPQ